MARLLLVSNRLPVTAQIEDGEIRLERSSGGLVAGLIKAHEDSRGVWLGWPGELRRLTGGQRQHLEESFAEQRIVPIYLTRSEVREFYEEVANGVLWPVFHYLIEQLPVRPQGWSTFKRINERFAQRVVEAYRPGDTIWVHDYHLVLVPALIRSALPRARIGFFLHIPFPAPEVFSVIPWREEILQGLLGADLVGFHTTEYADHFSRAVRRLLSLRATKQGISFGRRRVRVESFPMGIDAAYWSDLASQGAVEARAAEIEVENGGRKLLIGVDRLDYTKGLPLRLTAIESLFQDNPQLVDTLRVVQLVVPSREALETYSGLRRRLDEQVGRINSLYGTTTDNPVHMLNRSLAPEEVGALYRAADVMLVTPVRDGMNLVAKEFVASRVREDGVLILSEFAGAAEELKEALLVNPYDIEAIARRIREAIEMSDDEQSSRMRKLRQRVLKNDVHAWTDAFLNSLA
jgi:trehalose 6-phosphate synthase/phosphatase